MLVELSKVEQRYDAVLGVIRDGYSISEIAQAYGVSRQSVHAWLARYEAGGLPALGDRSHRPRTSPLQMDPAVEARVLELRRHHPSWGKVRLRYQLEHEGQHRCPPSRPSTGPWCVTGSSNPRSGVSVSRPINAGSGAGPWSCGRWTWWAGSS